MTPLTCQSSKHLNDLFTISHFCLNILPLEQEANQFRKMILWAEMTKVCRNIRVICSQMNKGTDNTPEFIHLSWTIQARYSLQYLVQCYPQCNYSTVNIWTDFREHMSFSKYRKVTTHFHKHYTNRHTQIIAF